MYRESTWTEGFYVDDYDKYECLDCGKQFILGRNMTEGCQPGFPVCPYCGQHYVERTVWTEDEDLETLESELGCLALTVQIKGEMK